MNYIKPLNNSKMSIKVKIATIVIGRTISMEKFSNEKQEVVVNVEYEEGEKISNVAKAAYAEADKAFVTMYPKYGVVNTEYTGYIKGIITKLAEVGVKEPAPQVSKETLPNIPDNVIGENPFKKNDDGAIGKGPEF
jgi:hypothetical protein